MIAIETGGWRSRGRAVALDRGMPCRDDDQLPLKLFAIDSWRGKRKVP